MCYLDAIKKGFNTIVVFEDDIVINKEVNQIIKGINEFNNSNYNVFYMGYCELNCNQQFKIDNTLELVDIPDYSKLWCCHSICYKVKYLPKIIKYLYPMDNEFDIKLTQIYKKLNYKICIPKNVYFDQNKQLGTNNETLNIDGSLLLSPPTCNF
jgi:CO dehydrogenase/acetyl-CoA synthase alpha subunit